MNIHTAPFVAYIRLRDREITEASDELPGAISAILDARSPEHAAYAAYWTLRDAEHVLIHVPEWKERLLAFLVAFANGRLSAWVLDDIESLSEEQCALLNDRLPPSFRKRT